MHAPESPVVDRSSAPTRYQSVYGEIVELKDLSGFVQETPSASAPDVDVVSAAKLFGHDEVVLGIGRPNVFLLIPDGNGRHVRYAAKSCWRGESRLERTMGIVQSGVFVILRGLTPEQVENVLESAKRHEGERGPTCVNANMRVLGDAGITAGNGMPLDRLYLPVSAFRTIQKYGLRVNETLLGTENVKTTERYLEHQAFRTNLAVLLTPFRHVKRFFQGLSKKKAGTDGKRPAKAKRTVSESSIEPGPKDLTLRISNPSWMAVPLRLAWGAHTVFTLEQNRADIDAYLPERLRAFPQENPSAFTRLKKTVLFNRLVVSGVNALLQSRTSVFPGKTESDIRNMFETHDGETPNRYNVVASKSGLMAAKIHAGNRIADWILSKHVLISNYHHDVRFAGEVWKDAEGTIWVNNNSGTYRPDAAQLEAFANYLREVFPNVRVRTEGA